MTGTDLIAWYPLHRTTGDVVDLSDGGNHGTNNGPTRGVVGKGGLSAHSFDGTDDTISVSFGTSRQMTTIAFWLYRTPYLSGSSGSFEMPFSIPGSNIKYIAIGDSTSATDTETLRIVNGTDTGQYTTASRPDGWNHIALVHINGRYEIAFNGSFVSTLTSTNKTDCPVFDESGFDLGARTGNSDGYLNGKIADFRVYDRPLSASELETLYQWGGGDYATPPGSANGGVSYWPLDETSGTTAADAWGSNDGTVYGATLGVDGIRGTAYSFDGIDDYIDTGITTDFQTGEFTASAWVYPTATPDGFRLVVDDTNGNGWALSIGDGATPDRTRFFVRGMDTVSLDANGVIAQNAWNHVVGVFNPTDITRSLYVNGERKSRLANDTGTPFTDAGTVTLGGTPTATFLSGRLDDVRVYDRALSPAEVHDLYRYGTRGRDLRKKTVNA